jgi:uncharacterized protein (TIGR01777 family)
VRVAITGSSGLIGRALTAELSAGGHQPVAIVRRPVRPRSDEIAWDPRVGRLDPDDLRGVDAVVNLAGAGIGEHRWSDERKQEILESRVRGTELLARTLTGMDPAAGRPSVLVSASAVGFYGDRGHEVLTEASGPGPDFLASVCVAWEAMAQAAEAGGIRVVMVRSGLVLSGQGGVLPRMVLPFRIGLGARLGSGRQWWSWITLGDEVRAITWLLTGDARGPVNLVSPNPVTNAEFTSILARVLHRPALLAVPAVAPRIGLGREMADALLFTSARVRPDVLLAGGFTFSESHLEEGLRRELRPG